MKRLKPVIIPMLALIVIVIGKYVIVAQDAYTGEWKAELRTDESVGKLQLNMYRKSKRNQTGSSFDLNELRGLSESQITGPSSAVRFSLVREAGTVDFDGTFEKGKGKGTFRFSPNMDFVAAMRTRGFDFEKRVNGEDDDAKWRLLFAATTLNVTVALADDLIASDFGKIETDDLFKAAIFKIDGAYAREMKATGFKNLSFDDLVKARIFKIDPEFVGEVARMGFENEAFESLVKMRIFRITPEFLAGIRAEGLNDLDIEDVVKLRIFNIDADYIRKARADGVPMNVEKLVQKKIGVNR